MQINSYAYFSEEKTATSNNQEKLFSHCGTPPKPARLLRKPEVLHRTGISNTGMYEMIKGKTFPAPVKLSSRSSAWLESDIDRWITERVNRTKAGGA